MTSKGCPGRRYRAPDGDADDGDYDSYWAAMVAPAGDAADAESDPAAALQAFVLDYSGGVPVYVREICRHLVETEAVVVSGDTAFLAAGDLDADDHLPPSLSRLVTLEYEGLPDAQKTLLQAAAGDGKGRGPRPPT